MDDQAEPWTTSRRGPLEHFDVAVRISERCDRTPADRLMDADRFAGMVVDEVDVGQTKQHRPAVATLVLHFDAAADHLLWRHTVDALDPRAHELDAAA